MNQLLKEVEAPYLKAKLPQFDVGDTVKVFVKIKEGGKERTQGYEGVVIKVGGHGLSRNFTVRRVFQGVGIERVFLIHSPRVEKITVLRHGHVRRSKLYYLRERTGKATRIKERLGVLRTVEDEAPELADAAAETAPITTPEATAAEQTESAKPEPAEAAAETIADETAAETPETPKTEETPAQETAA